MRRFFNVFDMYIRARGDWHDCFTDFLDHYGTTSLLRLIHQALRRVGLVDGITAARMTQHQLTVVLCAPLRVVLYENEADHPVLEHDRPSTLFGQFGDDRVRAVARKPDASLERVLAQAAS